MSKITGILCKSGKMFAACVNEFVDKEWIINEADHVKQDCTVVKVEETNFEKCECDHCKTMRHDKNEGVRKLLKDYQDFLLKGYNDNSTILEILGTDDCLNDFLDNL